METQVNQRVQHPEAMSLGETKGVTRIW